MKSRGVVVKAQISRSGRSVNFQLEDDWYWYYAPFNKNNNITKSTNLLNIKKPIELEWEDQPGRWRKVVSISFDPSSVSSDVYENKKQVLNKVKVAKTIKTKPEEMLSRMQIDLTMKWATINNYEIIRKNNIIYIKQGNGYKTINVAYRQNKKEIDNTK